MEGYASWDYKSPGISFSLQAGRIVIFRTTLEALDYPEYYRFLFNPENRLFAMQICGIDDEGAHRLPKMDPEGSCEIKSKGLVRLVYQICGWKKELTYRIPGSHIPGERLVNYDLADALEVYQGQLIEPKKNKQ